MINKHFYVSQAYLYTAPLSAYTQSGEHQPLKKGGANRFYAATYNGGGQKFPNISLLNLDMHWFRAVVLNLFVVVPLTVTRKDRGLFSLFNVKSPGFEIKSYLFLHL